jgi:hypothetical protein
MAIYISTFRKAKNESYREIHWISLYGKEGCVHDGVERLITLIANIY